LSSTHFTSTIKTFYYINSFKLKKNIYKLPAYNNNNSIMNCCFTPKFPWSLYYSSSSQKYKFFGTHVNNKQYSSYSCHEQMCCWNGNYSYYFTCSNSKLQCTAHISIFKTCTTTTTSTTATNNNNILIYNVPDSMDSEARSH